MVKLFMPDAGATWLLTEIDPDDETRCVGLCDLGLGCPEMGWADLPEIEAPRGPLGLPVERDLCFRADKPLSGYACEARLAGADRDVIDASAAGRGGARQTAGAQCPHSTLARARSLLVSLRDLPRAGLIQF